MIVDWSMSDDIELLPPEAETMWSEEFLESVCVQAEPGNATLDEAFQAHGVINWRNRVGLVRRAVADGYLPAPTGGDR